MKQRTIGVAMSAVFAIALGAQAATYYWDDGTVNVNATSGGGSGTWQVGTAGWEDGTSAQNWADGNDAVLGGTAGTLTLGGNISVGAVTLGVSGYVLNSNGNTLTHNGVMSGAYTLTYGGAGAFAINGINTNSGNLTIDTATVTVASGATLYCSGAGWAKYTVTLQNGGTLVANNFANGAGNLWGHCGDNSNNVIFGTGGGTFRMTGTTMDSTVNKGFTVNSGVTGHFYVPTGTSATWSGEYTSRDFYVNGGTLDFNGGGDFSTSRELRGSGNITKSDGGTLTLSGVNGFSGALTVNDGTLLASASTSGGSSSATGNGSSTNVITVNGGGTLKYTGARGAGYHSANVNINGGTITFDSEDNSLAVGRTVTFDTAAGAINGTGQWRFRGGATVAVTAAANNSTISVSALDLYDGQQTFDVASNTLLTVSSELTNQGGGTLRKTGNGILRLSGTSNSFTGATAVLAGVLDVTGSLASQVTASNAGTTVEGDGTFGGGLIMNAGTIHAPGNSPGAVTVANTLTYNDATLVVDIWTNSNGNVATPGTDFDQITINGATPTLTLSNTPQIVVDLNSTWNPTLGNSYVIITGFTNEVLSGFDSTVNVQNASPAWTSSGNSFQVDYNSGNISLTVIPEPATFGLLMAFGAAAMIRRRRIG